MAKYEEKKNLALDYIGQVIDKVFVEEPKDYGKMEEILKGRLENIGFTGGIAVAIIGTVEDFMVSEGLVPEDAFTEAIVTKEEEPEDSVASIV